MLILRRTGRRVFVFVFFLCLELGSTFRKIKYNKRKLTYCVVMETRLNPFDQSARVNGLKNEKFSSFLPIGKSSCEIGCGKENVPPAAG